MAKTHETHFKTGIEVGPAVSTDFLLDLRERVALFNDDLRREIDKELAQRLGAPPSRPAGKPKPRQESRRAVRVYRPVRATRQGGSGAGLSLVIGLCTAVGVGSFMAVLQGNWAKKNTVGSPVREQVKPLPPVIKPNPERERIERLEREVEALKEKEKAKAGVEADEGMETPKRTGESEVDNTMAVGEETQRAIQAEQEATDRYVKMVRRNTEDTNRAADQLRAQNQAALRRYEEERPQREREMAELSARVAAVCSPSRSRFISPPAQEIQDDAPRSLYSVAAPPVTSQEVMNAGK